MHPFSSLSLSLFLSLSLMHILEKYLLEVQYEFMQYVALAYFYFPMFVYIPISAMAALFSKYSPVCTMILSNMPTSTINYSY